MAINFYRVGDNAIRRRGFPWVAQILSGINSYTCRTCGLTLEIEFGDLEVKLTKKGTKWPDVLGVIGGPLIISENALDALRSEDVGEFPVRRVYILDPYPIKMRELKAPNYFWLDGRNMRGALLDFNASGFVGVKFCPECKNRTDNSSETYNRQHSKTWPFVFLPGSWNGSNLFTTDLSYKAFFCTEAVLQCARKYKLTNFEFIPVEKGVGYWTEPVKYM